MKRVSLVAAGVLLFLVGTGFIVRTTERFAMRAYRIPSSNMEPTLHCARPGSGCEAGTNDRILALRWAPFWTPGRGDIVVFKTPAAAEQKCGAGGTFVKRLIGLPGETWEERDGVVYINGKRLIEPYVTAGRRDKDSYPKRTIPAGYYFFMGDNRSQSCDSREFGSVPRANFIGPVVAIYWPFDRMGLT